jgi:hypothetical protein
MIKRLSLVFLIFVCISSKSTAQFYENSGYFHEGEVGVSLGMGHYFGDLNTNAGLQNPLPAFGVFVRKSFGHYISLRASGKYGQLGYSDIYHEEGTYQWYRNLNFSTDIYEFTVQGDFNFFRYIPNDVMYGFTPYVTLGVGLCSFNPKARDQDGVLWNLVDLKTEGQATPYSTQAIVVPFGVGIKYSISKKMNLNIEYAHRFTTTDYLDDVSTTYVGDDLSGTNPNQASQNYLQDPSRFLSLDGNPIFKKGQQRGWSKQKDQYGILEVGISFNIGSYRCPKALD